MVIRNPYGFIVKHYKLINLLLLIPILYLVFVMGDLAGFFRDYVGAGYSTKETNITESYITILTYVSTAIVLLSNILIYAIIATKKKTSIYHLVGSIYYIIVLIVLFFLAGALQSIADHAMDATFANFVRDTATISSLPGYVMLIWGFVDAIGFNIKTFRIDNHVELKVSEDEEDDIEIKVGSDNNTIKRNSVHFVRELKYYVLENKFVFTCIFIVLALIVGYTTYSNYQLYNKTYTINQNFTLDNFSISVKDSYITNVDYRGSLINSGKYYLAIKIGIHNQTARDTAIERSNFRIYIGDEIIYPSYDKSSRFIDIGKMYLGEVIAAGSSDDYVFVYELTKDQVKSSYEMRILNGLTQKKEKLLTKYKKISIKPQNILKTQEIGEAKTKQQLDLSNTTLGETTFKLNKLKIVQSYEYRYKSCAPNGSCKEVKELIVPTGGNVLVIIEDDLKYDKESSYYKNGSRDFYTDFVTLEYKYTLTSITTQSKKGKTKLINVTPKIMTDQSIYEAPATLLYATDIDMKVQVRNQYLTIDAK